jgi:hypothetical protein
MPSRITVDGQVVIESTDEPISDVEMPAYVTRKHLRLYDPNEYTCWCGPRLVTDGRGYQYYEHNLYAPGKGGN